MGQLDFQTISTEAIIAEIEVVRDRFETRHTNQSQEDRMYDSFKSPCNMCRWRERTDKEFPCEVCEYG